LNQQLNLAAGIPATRLHGAVQEAADVSAVS